MRNLTQTCHFLTPMFLQCASEFSVASLVITRFRSDTRIIIGTHNFAIFYARDQGQNVYFLLKIASLLAITSYEKFEWIRGRTHLT